MDRRLTAAGDLSLRESMASCHPLRGSVSIGTSGEAGAPNSAGDRMTGMAAASQLHSPPGWLLDEVASAGRENLDADHVSRYDSKMDAEAAEELVLLK